MDWSLPYPSRRSPLCAANVVATSQPLAAQAGLFMLKEGGNAVDAAIATAAALTVVEPTSNGIGSDAFAIVHDGESLHGLNASGRSPAALTLDALPDRAMPKHGWLPVTVPGAVSAWAALHERFGKLPFERLMQPAIEYAERGFQVSPIVADAWRRSVTMFKDRPEFLATFAVDGAGPQNGQRVALPDHAKTLGAIARSKGEDFYRGEVARAIALHAKETGGLLSLDDLGAHACDWVEPIATVFGHTVIHEIPPNGQGIAVLMALNSFSEECEAEPVDSGPLTHELIENMKYALSRVYREVSDPQSMTESIQLMLIGEYCADRHATPMPTIPQRGGTVYLTTADASGMMVSFIQSNFWGFGSGIVVPGTGVAMQNRGFGFSCDPNHPNCVAPRKRPFHTIIPGFATDARGKALCAFGVMGGAMQAQGHLQVVTRMFAHGQNPQAALDAPRWRVMDGLDVLIEPGFPEATLADLRLRGHVLKGGPSGEFGGGQVILRSDDGYIAGSDWRKDGAAVGF
jgi:gamma-glutamyltranspeptidase / glutathione hydrolase